MSEPLTSAESAAWRAVLALADQLRFRVANEVKPQTGLSSADHSVLIRLHEAPQRSLGQKELGAAMAWTKSRLSHHLTRMQVRGLVERTTLSGQNGVLVSLTDDGAAAVAAAVGIHAAAVRRHLLERVGSDEIELLIRLADRLVGGAAPLEH